MAIPYIPGIGGYFKIENVNLNFFDILIGSYNPISDFAYPIAYQFWFIRDLIVCVIFSPILFLLISKIKVIWICFAGLGWLLGMRIPIIGIYGFSIDSIFFFSLGAYISIYKIDLIALFKDMKLLAFLYPVIAITDLLSMNESYNAYIHNIGILCGIVFIFLLVADLLEKNTIRPVPFLTSASFFIFAIHDPWLLRQLRKLFYRFINPQTDMGMCVSYFMLVLAVVFISLIIYKILINITPKFISVITGSR